jgi:hypothetical protein
MTIEINHANSPFVYRIDPKDARNIWRRENKLASKWYFYLRRDTIPEARRTLLQLQGKDDTPPESLK